MRFKPKIGGPLASREVRYPQALWEAGRVSTEFAMATLGLSAVVVTVSSIALAASPRSGHDVFMHNACFACHGELGYGGAGPGFRGDKMLAADDYVVGRILFGGGIMPPFGGELSDVEIASVGTYIRNNWGNQFGAISPEKVAAARQTLSGGNAQNPPRAQGATQ